MAGSSAGLPGMLPRLGRARRLLPLLVVGATAGLIGAAYLGALHLLQSRLGPGNTSTAAQSALLVATGAGLAMVARWLGSGSDVELLVDNIHLNGDAGPTQRVDRALIPTSLIGISVGSTLGPEAPLVQTCGTMGSAVARRLRAGPQDARVLTLVGMAAGFTVLFGTPVGATVFALEMLHRRGLEYYEALVPALVGGLSGYGVFVLGTTLGMRPVWDFAPVPSIRSGDLAAAVLAGLVGACVATIFARVVAMLARLTSRAPRWSLPILGGTAMALLGLWSPYALTFGEHQVPDLLVPGLATSAIVVALVAKLLGAAACLTGRWRGGFIIPLFFCGAAAGQLLANSTGWSSQTVIVTAGMAATVTGVMKTPLGAPLVVAGMSGLALLPTTLVASIVSLALSRRVSVITSQRPRPDPPQHPAPTGGHEGTGPPGR